MASWKPIEGSVPQHYGIERFKVGPQAPQHCGFKGFKGGSQVPQLCGIEGFKGGPQGSEYHSTVVLWGLREALKDHNTMDGNDGLKGGPQVGFYYSETRKPNSDGRYSNF